MSRVPTGGGKFIKADEVMNGETAVIKTEADWIDTQYTKEDGTKQQQYVCRVEYKGEERQLKLTMASCEELVVMGEDSADWIGQTVTFEKVKVNVGGKIKDSIWVKPAHIQKPAEATPMTSSDVALTPEQQAKADAGEPWDE